MTHEEECAVVDQIIEGIAQKHARRLIGSPTLLMTPAEDLEGVVERQVGLYESFLSRHGVNTHDVAVSVERYRYHLVCECARIARVVSYDGGNA